MVSVKPHLQPCPQEETQIDMFNACPVVHHRIKLGVGAHHTSDTPYSGKYTPISHGAHSTYMHVCPSIIYINLLLCVNILDHVLIYYMSFNKFYCLQRYKGSYCTGLLVTIHPQSERFMLNCTMASASSSLFNPITQQVQRVYIPSLHNII